MLSYIKHEYRHLSDDEYIKIRLVDDVDVNITRNDIISGDGNVLLVIRSEGNTIMINGDKIIMAQKRKVR